MAYLPHTVVIVTGGHLGEWALAYIDANSYIIGADRGALFLVQHGIRPDLAVGDFDSVSPQELEQIQSVSKQLLRCDAFDKNYTDTELAFIKALERHPERIIIAGALGSRFDHSLANVQLLAQAEHHGIVAVIADEHNEVRLVTRSITVERGRFSMVSLLSLSAEVTGIHLQGFVYPLHNATLALGQSLGISNVLDHESGTITIDSGSLLVIHCNG